LKGGPVWRAPGALAPEAQFEGRSSLEGARCSVPPCADSFCRKIRASMILQEGCTGACRHTHTHCKMQAHTGSGAIANSRQAPQAPALDCTQSVEWEVPGLCAVSSSTHASGECPPLRRSCKFSQGTRVLWCKCMCADLA